MDKYQQIRLKLEAGDNNIRISSETDKNYKYVKGIYVSLPFDCYQPYATLGLKIGQTELFTEDHEAKLLSCGSNVAPNDMFFRFDGKVEASGSVVEGRFKMQNQYGYTYLDVIIYLWLSNHEPK